MWTLAVKCINNRLRKLKKDNGGKAGGDYNGVEKDMKYFASSSKFKAVNNKACFLHPCIFRWLCL